MVGATKEYLNSLVSHFIENGLPKEAALRIAVSRAMYISLNITEVATEHHFDLIKTALVYFTIGGTFNLVWFRDQIATDSREGHWNTMARLSLRDELDAIQRQLTIVILQSNKTESDPLKLVKQWRSDHHHAISRWESILNMLYGSTSIDYVMFFIALRELTDLVQGSVVAA
jgi:glutamate dehydrogenase